MANAIENTWAAKTAAKCAQRVTLARKVCETEGAHARCESE